MLCASVNTQGRTAPAGLPERPCYDRAGPGKSLTRSGPNRHGRTHKNKKQPLGRNMMRRQSNFRRMAWASLVLAAAVTGLSHASHAADEWPTRDITFYVPYAPGGSTDPISRKYAELLEKQLKVKVIVENKPGASAPVSSLPLPPNSGLLELGISNCRSRICPTSIGRGEV